MYYNSFTIIYDSNTIVLFFLFIFAKKPFRMLLEKRIPFNYIVNKVRYDALYVLIVYLFVQLITQYYRHWLPDLPLTIPTFIGTAISILLSFKLNQSYDRWWEARKIWGSIVNDSRTLVLQLKTFVRDNEEVVKRMGFRQIAWCYSLGQSLRKLDPAGNLSSFISGEELAEILKHQNKPLALVDKHGEDLKLLKQNGQIELFSMIQLNETLVRLMDSQGRAERIKTTIFPATYKLFLHLIIYLFVVLLSISLKEVSWYFEMPLLLLISTAFFLLEKSATHMQDPFENRPTDTAVTAIATTIEVNIRQLLNDNNLPDAAPKESFYQL